MTEFIDRSVNLASSLVPGKALILYGPRRAGRGAADRAETDPYAFSNQPDGVEAEVQQL